MSGHPYFSLHAEYESWVAHVRVNPDRVAEVDHVARRLVRQENLAHYDDVFAKIGVPQVVQATICEREDGNDFTKSPAQGDPWNRKSTHVPRNIGPFSSWTESAVYSWTVADRLNVISVPEWTLPYACFKWEGYNGFGPRGKGKRTSYVVGGTNLQQPGKYVSDGVWDPNHMDTQLGALPVAMRMIEILPRLTLGGAVAIVSAPPLVPVQAPPMSVGGGLTGTRWVQNAANVLLDLRPPLDLDGSFGRHTRDAVRALQTKFYQKVDGLVDDELCDAIDAGLAAMRPKS